jgi:hypothetical protein
MTVMQPSPHSKHEALDASPVPSAAIHARTTDQGLVRIRYPILLRPWLARLLPRGASLPVRTLELDSMGSFVWGYIDGERTVRDLAVLVASRYGCHASEAEHAVAAFVRHLGRRGILGLR